MTGFRSHAASRELSRAARTVQGRARDDVYAELDALSRATSRPWPLLDVLKEVTLVSNRVSCIVLRPVLDLAVACLK